ncbi:MAG TPA: rhodanese-like domain-containing protein [Lacipirellulaceae bacterium]|jgi:rhodanese-related sulfurtransferase|nr:rhodanese-like domain-containing protein [Lacipirellulaceae bacterium]
MNSPSVKTISSAELHRESQQRAVDLVDVRTVEEFNEIRAVGARNVPLDRLDPAALIKAHQDPAQPIYFICAVGGRSAWACELMKAMGYENVVNVEGGTQEWHAAGLPTERGASSTSF